MAVLYLTEVYILVCSFGLSFSVTNKAVFSSKTAYEWVPKQNVFIGNDQYKETILNGKTCTAVHVNMVGRHGYRNPGADDMEDYTKLRDKLVASKEKYLFPFLDSWVNRFQPSKEDMLVERGRQEWKEIGQRLAKKFKTLLQNSTKSVELVSSNKERTINSSNAFYSGFTKELLGTELTNRPPVINDTLLRFYKDCTKYELTVEDNASTYSQVRQFQASSYIQDVMKAILARLGIKNTTTANSVLENNDLEIIYDLCALEMAIYEDDDWCSLMSHGERKVLEYLADLENYYEDSYGSDINAELGCVLVENMFTEMDQVISNITTGKSYTTGSFKFGHSQGMRRLYTALGLHKDDTPPLATNMAEMADRKLRTSTDFPMAANLAFALYTCPNDGSDTNFAITLFLNEEPATIPICGSSTCRYADIRQAYSDLVDRCSREEICKYDANPSSASNINGNPQHVLLCLIMAFLTLHC